MDNVWERSSVALDQLGCPPPKRIALLTDFGSGPYIGQLMLLAGVLAPGLPVVNLLDDLPSFRPDLAAYLLPGLTRGMPSGTLYLCVVDPGVGGERGALAVRCGPNWFVGPDNGLLVQIVRRCGDSALRLWRIDWRPKQSSESFHGRDLFLPIAIALTLGRLQLPCQSVPPKNILGYHDPLDCQRILYVDRYGNLMTGLGGDRRGNDGRIRAGGRMLCQARTFCDCPVGVPFWYHNAFGLIELAVNQGRADELLGLSVGDPIHWELGKVQDTPSVSA
nr:SAM-dependent chlorinase/fluorinase [Thiorhodovibrio winogradskyi]